jgi:hypothetical protein
MLEPIGYEWIPHVISQPSSSNARQVALNLTAAFLYLGLLLMSFEYFVCEHAFKEGEARELECSSFTSTISATSYRIYPPYCRPKSEAEGPSVAPRGRES